MEREILDKRFRAVTEESLASFRCINRTNLLKVRIMMQLSIIPSNCILVSVQYMIFRIQNSPDLLLTLSCCRFKVTTSTIEHNRTPPPPPPNPKVIDDGTWSEGENVTGHRSRWMAAFGSCNDGGRGGVGFGRAGACGDFGQDFVPRELGSGKGQCGWLIQCPRRIQSNATPSPKVIDDLTGRGQERPGKNVTGHRARWTATFGYCDDGRDVLDIPYGIAKLDTALLLQLCNSTSYDWLIECHPSVEQVTNNKFNNIIISVPTAPQ
ncbi:hypothetical protein CEXT_423291 [Caerostris extrusa]|uniref:Uncharacterized protein n=1 Tax=Caerostris extrusa TaxID=172846 RepID=A0AAV4VYB4_CAEEX|nr:hypothetical protein CEXT_423291 [Caerostris extrusa]